MGKTWATQLAVKQATAQLPKSTQKDVDQVLQIVAIHGANVVKAQLFKQRTARATNHAACILVDLGGGILNDARQLLCHTLGNLTQLTQLAIGLEEQVA